MAERAMKGTHRECGCEICVKHDDTAICDFCKVAWPCDASIGRAALERIEALAEGWHHVWLVAGLVVLIWLVFGR